MVLEKLSASAKVGKEGGGIGWVRPTRLNLITLKETSAGPLTCHYVE
jgi:hypothetical protein